MDRAAKPVTGSVVVVAVNGEHTVKRLRRGEDCVWLEPANPRYRPTRISVGEELHIFGVVRHAIHTMRGAMGEGVGLIDCNNFYVSCERVFRPDLQNVPVIVLSNNDGCAIARSADYVESAQASNFGRLFK